MKVALIGAGQIARQHIGCLKTLPGVELAAICDLSAVTAEAAAERYGFARWFTDHRELLERARPDVVHITTPPTSHFALADACMQSGAHVIVEKPITATFEELAKLVHRARETGRHLVEDHNYVFNRGPQEILRLIADGSFGSVVHVEILISLDILGPSGFADPNAPHPALKLAGGAIADFLPHLASLAHAFIGSHQTAQTVWGKRKQSPLPYDEFRALVEGERGTAALAFSASARPEAFWLRVHGERMQAATNLFETRLTIDRPRRAPKPLQAFFNGLDEGRTVRRAAVATLLRKFKGPGAYEGLWELLARTYRALADGAPLPVTLDDVVAVNELVESLKPKEPRP